MVHKLSFSIDIRPFANVQYWAVREKLWQIRLKNLIEQINRQEQNHHTDSIWSRCCVPSQAKHHPLTRNPSHAQMSSRNHSMTSSETTSSSAPPPKTVVRVGVGVLVKDPKAPSKIFCGIRKGSHGAGTVSCVRFKMGVRSHAEEDNAHDRVLLISSLAGLARWSFGTLRKLARVCGTRSIGRMWFDAFPFGADFWTRHKRSHARRGKALRNNFYVGDSVGRHETRTRNNGASQMRRMAIIQLGRIEGITNSNETLWPSQSIDTGRSALCATVFKGLAPFAHKCKAKLLMKNGRDQYGLLYSIA